ncbi:hypothetical protein JCM8097_009441 [Rhodosporidiobolus ruineniae]
MAAPSAPPAPASGYSTFLCTTPEHMARSLAIRHEVFCVEQGYDPKIEVDHRDKDCDHILMVKTNEDGMTEDVGTIRWYAPESKLGRFAIRSPFRGGTGRLLSFALEEHIRTRSGRAADKYRGMDEAEVLAYAQMIAIGFYDRNGWERVGEVFMEEGQPHCKVSKKIKLVPE